MTEQHAEHASQAIAEALTAVSEELAAKRAERAALNIEIRSLVAAETTLRQAARPFNRRAMNTTARVRSSRHTNTDTTEDT